MFRDRPRIIAICYTIDPKLGSEPGAAWGVVRTLMEVADVDVLVSSLEYDQLEAWRQQENEQRIRFVSVHPSSTSSIFWKLSHLDGGPFAWFLKAEFVAYWIWLSAAKRVGLNLEKTVTYAAAIHVSYASYWLPSPVVDFKAPGIWGPVGGATRTPIPIWRYLGVKGVCGELFKFLAVRLVSLLPSVRRTWREADFRLAETENTRRALSKSLQDGTMVLNRAALQNVPSRAEKVPRKRYILFPSRLQPRKGPRLAIDALRYAGPDVRLVFVADGMERRALQRMAKRIGVADKIEFRGWVERNEMFRMVCEAAAVLFTGTREEGGCALAEAMQLGTPVIVLGVGGAKLLAETNTDPSRVAIVEPNHNAAKELGRSMTAFTDHPAEETSCFLDREAVTNDLLGVLSRAVESGGRQLCLPDNQF